MVALFLYGDRSFGSNIRNDPKMRGVAYESGLEGIFGSMPSYVRIGFLLLFFAVSYYFAMNKSSVIDKIGNYLTPSSSGQPGCSDHSGNCSPH